MKPGTPLPCATCGRPTVTLHELAPGHGRRQLCIQYDIQVPLCDAHHRTAHTNAPKFMAQTCYAAGIDYNALHIAFDKRDYDTMKKAGEIIKARWLHD